MSDTTTPVTEPRHPQVAYEPTDASFGGVVTFGVILAAVLVAISVGVWVVVGFLGRSKPPELPWTSEERNTVSPWSTASEGAGKSSVAPDRSYLGPTPFLEGMEANRSDGEIDRWRQTRTAKVQAQEQDAFLDRPPGWIDRKAGVIHIPIEEAMRLEAARAKTRKGKEIDEFLDSPGRSSSGRVPRGGTP